MYTHAWICSSARADVHTEVWTSFLCLALFTLGPCYVKSQIKAAVLLRATDRSEEKEIQRGRKSQHPETTPATSAFALIISSLSARRTQRCLNPVPSFAFVLKFCFTSLPRCIILHETTNIFAWRHWFLRLCITSWSCVTSTLSFTSPPASSLSVLFLLPFTKNKPTALTYFHVALGDLCSPNKHAVSETEENKTKKRLKEKLKKNKKCYQGVTVCN